MPVHQTTAAWQQQIENFPLSVLCAAVLRRSGCNLSPEVETRLTRENAYAKPWFPAV
jgi:hypothetical protein